MAKLKLAIILAAGLLGLSGAHAANQVGESHSSRAVGRERCPACTSGQGHLQPVYYFEDPRKMKMMPRTLSGHNSAGELGLTGIGIVKVVRNHRQSAGNGIAVSPCHILTNYHVAFTLDMTHPSSSVKVNFLYGQCKEVGSFAGSISASPVDHPESAGHGWGNRMLYDNEVAKEDWALLRLDKCLPKEVSYLSLFPADAKGGVDKSFETAGLLQGLPNPSVYLFYREPFCQILGYAPIDVLKNIVDPTVLMHYCADAPGASGAPIMVRVNGRPMVFAIDAGDGGGADLGVKRYGQYEIAPKNGPGTNGAVPMRAIYPRLFALLAAEEGYIKQQTGQDWHLGDQAP